MARIPVLSRDELSPEGQAVYDHIAKTRGALRGPYGVMLHHPALAERVAAVGEQIRFRSLLSGADRELAVLAAAREVDAPYEWAAHEPIARREGVEAEAIAVVRERRPTDGLSARESVLVDTVRALFQRRRLDEAEYALAEAELGPAELVELITLAGYYGMIGFVLNAFEVDLPAEAAAAEMEAFNRHRA
jgi:4-carboxymuconolactone decarboxylase